MICDVRNANPNNTTIDGTISSERKLSFVFYGSHTIGADFFIYDANTMLWATEYYWLMRREAYNGEECYAQIGTNHLLPNKKYIWNTRVYQSVDIENSNFPSTIVTNGQVQSSPWIAATVSTFPYNSRRDMVQITSGLDIKMPAYLYYNNTTTGFSEYYSIISYSKATGVVKTNKSYPATCGLAAGDTMTICTVQSNVEPETGDIYVAIEPDNNQMPTNQFYYKYKVNTSDETETAYAYYLKINDQYRAITTYSRDTGICKILSKFTDSEGEDIDVITAGTNYEIYAAFVWPPNFYFETKAKPVISAALTYEDQLLHCTAEITNQYYDIKYYQWEIYLSENDTMTKIDTSAKIYNQRLDYYCRAVLGSGTYYAKYHIMTQDNRLIENTTLVTTTLSTSGSAISGLTAAMVDNSVHLSWNCSSNSVKSYTIMRKNKNTNTIRYIGTKKSASVSTYVDSTCESNGSYTYYVIPKGESTVYTAATTDIDVSFNEVCIYFMRELTNAQPSTSVSDSRNYSDMYDTKNYTSLYTYLFPAEISFSQIKNNLAAKSIETYGRKPIVTYGNQNYDSFSLTFDFMKLNSSCAFDEYSADKFAVWREYINNHYPVMIKDAKGNVWIGSITSHNFEVEYDTPTYEPYVVTIEFTQTRENNKSFVSEETT